MVTQQDVLDLYTEPGLMTSNHHAVITFEGLPCEIPALVETVQGLLLHEHWAAHAYGVELTDEHRAETHIRSINQMIERLETRGSTGLSPLPVDDRIVGTCRNFTLLLVAMLRAQGVPARARCGFGAYFNPGMLEDHWVAEYWNGEQARWIRVDAQIDAVQRQFLTIDFDLLDVPPDRFVSAGEAWSQCRAGDADAAKFGLSFLNESGLWFIAGNLIRDAAALNNMEMLPWDVWGGMPSPDEQLSQEQLAFFDQLAAYTRQPDTSLAELRARWETDERLHVPDTVFNAVLNQSETI